jgi:UTP--glucose-1-phosphate uridylyltransferase
LAEIDEDLGALDDATRERLCELGVDESRLRGWVSGLLLAGPGVNRVRGTVLAMRPADVADLPPRDGEEGRRLEQLGLDAIAGGGLAMVVLAGGMATRMGGVVKGLVDAVPGTTFLDARLAERAYWQERTGAAVPMWLMTSHATDGPIRAALGDRIDGSSVETFMQGTSLRVTPGGRLFREADGAPSVHATGHGDLPDALHAAGLVEPFIRSGGRYLWIMNLDNLGATVDPLVLGWHVDHGAPLTVEVVDKAAGDRGGIPVRLDGRPVVLENFRLPEDFDEHSVRVFNTNTFIANAVSLRDLSMRWSWFRVEKVVDGRPAIQFERLVGELTSALDSRFLRVPREGGESRFLPAKDWSELEANRDRIAARIAPFLARDRNRS